MQSRHLITLLLTIFILPAAYADDVPTGTRTNWRHKRTPIFTTSQGVPYHRCRDGLVASDRPQELICKFAYGPWDKDLEDEDVELFVLAEGEKTWRRVGVGRTGKDGHGDRARGIHDLGGWLIFSIPEASALSVGRHRFRAVVRGDGTAAEATLWIATSGSAVVIFDIDGTLTISDSELTQELVAAGTRKRYHQKIHPGAADVVRARAAAGALPVYVSARPDRLTARTRSWLDAEELPAGPLRLQSSVVGSVSKSRTESYKEGFVAALLERGLSVVAAYGNAVTDIDAYLGAGLDPTQIFIVGPHRGEKGTVPVADYREHLKTLIPLSE